MQLGNVICNGIVHNRQIHIAIFMNDPVPQALDCPPGDIGIICFEVIGQLVGVFGDLNQPEHNRVQKDLVGFQFGQRQSTGVLDNKSLVGYDPFNIVLVIFLVIHKSLYRPSVSRL